MCTVREYAGCVPVTLATLFAVFVGGVVGSSARLAVEFALESVSTDGWPYGILVANLVGSFAMGWAVGVGFARIPAWARTGLTTGVLGSFTTLSAISLDLAAPVLQHGVAGLAVVAPYAIGSIFGGLLVALWGLRLGTAVRGDGR